MTRAFGTTRLQKAKRPAAVIVVGTIGHAVGTSRGRPITDIGLFVMERVLLLLIIAELLHTLQVVDLGGRILVEPFLFIGLIAVVRRVLVLMAEAEGGAAPRTPASSSRSARWAAWRWRSTSCGQRAGRRGGRGSLTAARRVLSP